MIKIKSPREVEGINKSCALILEIHQKIGKMDLVGMSTKSIDDFIGDEIEKAGATSGKGYRDWKFNSCISVNDELVHGVPSEDRIIQDGDLVSVDLFLRQDGVMWGDSATTFIAGDEDDEANATQLHLKKVAIEAFFDAFGVCMEGRRLQEVIDAIRNTIVNKHGLYTNNKYTGHGIGYNLHEPPIVPCTGPAPENIKLVPGMVLALEPLVQMGNSMTYVEDDGWTVKNATGELCSHFERCVLITDHTPQILGTHPEGTFEGVIHAFED